MIVIWVPEGRTRELPECIGDVPVHCSAEPPDIVTQWIAEGATFIAHNAAGFDKYAWEVLVGGQQPTWYDTLPCARAAGLPGGLDALGKALIGRGKDAGSAALKLLYTVKVKDGRPVYPVGTVHLWRSMLQYNVQDVLLLEAVYLATKGYIEPEVLAIDHIINERGCPASREHARKLSELWTLAQSEAAERVDKLTAGDISEEDIRSPQKVKRWLAAKGINLPALNQQQLEQFYDDPGSYSEHDNPEISNAIEMLQTRRTAVRATRGKVERALLSIDADDRARWMFRYMGAHTGRWSGTGLQPQNMARGSSWVNVEDLLSRPLTLDAIKQHAEGKGTVDDVLVTLFRSIIRAGTGNTLVICDYAGIEARGVAWLAGESKALAVFADTSRDIYCEMAGSIYGRPITKRDTTERQIGKIVTLGCGYGMGKNRFGSFCKLSGIDLEAAGVTADDCVDAYRATYPRIPALWKALDAHAKAAVKTGKPHSTHGITFSMDGSNLLITLHSGRNLIYRGAAIVKKVPRYAEMLGLPLEVRPALVYRHHFGYMSDLYGGLLAENIVQAECRDLLADALVKCRPLNSVLHVHDEIVNECPEDEAEENLRSLANIMSTGPEWVEGFPIRVEGYTCPVYSKKPWKQSVVVDSLGGTIL